MSQGAPASLRDLYNPHKDNTSWSFQSSSSSAMSSAATPTHSAKIPSWKPTSPQITTSFEGTSFTAKMVLRGLLASTFVQFSTSAVATPWEVGKVLLQVQWIPKQLPLIEDGEDNEADEQSESSSSSSEDPYFHDPTIALTSTPRPRHKPKRKSTGLQEEINRSRSTPAPRSLLIIPYGAADGVWGMMKRLGSWRSEGWLSLWKGLSTSFIMDLTTTSLINTLPFSSLTSHIAIGLLLSPLDYLRTRQIIHPRTQSHDYPTLSSLAEEEGGYLQLWLSPRLLVPSVLDNTLRPAIAFWVTKNYFGGSGVSGALGEFVGGVVALGLTLPIETVRRRLQAQRGPIQRGHEDNVSISSCVTLRPTRYNNIFDTLWTILTEERSTAPLPQVRKGKGPRRSRGGSRGGRGGHTRTVSGASAMDTESSLSFSGLPQLYRGFGMGVTALGIVLILALVSGGEEEGWAEL